MSDEGIYEMLVEEEREEERRRLMDIMNSYGEVFWPWPDERPGEFPRAGSSVQTRSVLQLTAAGTAPGELPAVDLQPQAHLEARPEVRPQLQRQRLIDILQAWARLCHRCSVNVIARKESVFDSTADSEADSETGDSEVLTGERRRD
eukprot:426412-Heterocapsa_arctica.AAC.1